VAVWVIKYPPSGRCGAA